jgi:hypothetical protein
MPLHILWRVCTEPLSIRLWLYAMLSQQYFVLDCAEQ